MSDLSQCKIPWFPSKKIPQTAIFSMCFGFSHLFSTFFLEPRLKSVFLIFQNGQNSDLSQERVKDRSQFLSEINVFFRKKHLFRKTVGSLLVFGVRQKTWYLGIPTQSGESIPTIFGDHRPRGWCVFGCVSFHLEFQVNIFSDLGQKTILLISVIFTPWGPPSPPCAGGRGSGLFWGGKGVKNWSKGSI